MDGQPFWAFAGRCTTQPPMPPDRMEAEIWMKMDQSHLNTLIVPVYWETLEPEEGSYDFSLVDSLLEQAVRFKKKLILLWFGLWKNAESAYVPAWMKQDSETFPCGNVWWRKVKYDFSSVLGGGGVRCRCIFPSDGTSAGG